jgi:hypothetical protein
VLPLATAADAATPAAKTAASKIVRIATLYGNFDNYIYGNNHAAAYVTPKGTVLTAWLNNTPSGQAIMVGRKAKSGTRFTTHKLGTLALSGVPYLGRPGGGTALVAMVVDGNTQALDAWRSSNDGTSWTRMDLTALNGQLAAAGLWPAGGSVVDIGGATYAQVYATATSTSEIVTLPASLDSYTVVQSSPANSALSIAAGGGTVFSIQNAPTATIPFTAGTHDGSITFPCADNLVGNVQVVGTTSGAAAIATGCGAVYARSISPTGALGKAVKIAAAPGGKLANGYATGHVAVASIGGTAHVLFSDPSADLRMASTRNGTTWTVGKGLVPMVAGGGATDGGPIPALSGGTASWLVAETTTSATTAAVLAAPTSATYQPPSYPSKRGLGKSAHARLGSFAATAPVAFSHKQFKSGRDDAVSVHVHSALNDTITVNVTVEQVSSQTIEILYGSTATQKVKAGKAASITAKNYPSGSIGKKDRVLISVAGRTGVLTFTGTTT